jgi:polysaccharide export outer membrane protein
VAAAVALTLLVASPGIAQEDSGTSAEIRISLPAGASAVAMSPGPDRIVLELPAGATFPDDFARSSGGLLRDGRVEENGDTVELELNMALGVLSRVEYEPDAVVLRFESRFLPRSELADPDEQYLLGADDKILVTVHNRPELTTELTVTREGLITAPLVKDVMAAGLTPRQLAARVAELLGRNYLVNPQVDVSVLEYRSQWVIVTGEVLRPGRIPLRGGTRLKEILGETEGFGEEAGESITISRKIPGTDEVKTLYVGRHDFESGRTDPTLAHGDIIEVGRADYCYIQGEVRDAGRVSIERGMTLMRVISLAGGLTDWADRKNVRVLSGSGAGQTTDLYNLKKIEQGRAPDPEMRGGEVIIIKKRFL